MSSSASASSKAASSKAASSKADAGKEHADNGQDAGNQQASAWAHMVGEMKRASTEVDWSKIDLTKLAPKDIGVHVGPMMTEEQFKAYRARTGPAGVHVVKAPAPQK
jgi:hypothetical protein